MVQVVSQSGRHRGCVHYPSAAVRVAPVSLAVGEALMWRLVTASRILSAMQGAGTGAAPGLQPSGMAGPAAQVTGQGVLAPLAHATRKRGRAAH